MRRGPDAPWTVKMKNVVEKTSGEGEKVLSVTLGFSSIFGMADKSCDTQSLEEAITLDGVTWSGRTQARDGTGTITTGLSGAAAALDLRVWGYK